jgi:solute carrier family 26 (sodium-independent sulfate anion transporter), member 11
VLDCSAVNNVDITSVQGLVDLRSALDRYAAPAVVEWRFAGLQSRWARRALAIAGFGFPAADDADQLGSWRPVWTVATGLAGATDEEPRDCKDPWVTDEENGAAVEAVNDAGGKSNYTSVGREGKARREGGVATVAASRPSSSAVGDLEPLYAVDRPFFHVDLLDAVEAAVRDAMKKDEGLLL